MENNQIIIDLNLNVYGGGGASDNLNPQAPSESTDAQTTVAKSESAMSKTIASYVGVQAVKWATSNYGNLTGDYLTQTHITEALTIGGSLLIASKSPMGAVAVATSFAVKGIERAIDLKKQAQESEVLRQRVGRVVSSGGRDL